MNSVRPYLIRALIDWIVDNECTPYMAISCAAPGVDVPAEYATDDKLVLNISATATRGFSIAEERVDVDCRFRGQPVHISVPVGAVVAVYARENGMGMAFEVETQTPPSPPKASGPKPGGAQLKLVK